MVIPTESRGFPRELHKNPTGSRGILLVSMKISRYTVGSHVTKRGNPGKSTIVYHGITIRIGHIVTGTTETTLIRSVTFLFPLSWNACTFGATTYSIDTSNIDLFRFFGQSHFFVCHVFWFYLLLVLYLFLAVFQA